MFLKIGILKKNYAEVKRNSERAEMLEKKGGREGGFLYLKIYPTLMKSPVPVFLSFPCPRDLLQLAWILSKCHKDERDRKSNKDEDRKLTALYLCGRMYL